MRNNIILTEFIKQGGVLKTADLRAMGFTSRQIRTLVTNGHIIKIKHGFYEHTAYTPADEVVIARLFPRAIVFLESALMHYGYTDRIPLAWQIAVDRDSEKTQYKIDYPLIEPFYLEAGLLQIGLDSFRVDGVDVAIYDRDRTICDILRHEAKLETEVFRSAVRRYVDDPRSNPRKLHEYAELLRVTKKVTSYLEVWL